MNSVGYATTAVKSVMADWWYRAWLLLKTIYGVQPKPLQSVTYQIVFRDCPHVPVGAAALQLHVVVLMYTVRRKMFAINNFREFREWSTFANIIIRELLCSHIHGIFIYSCTHYYNYVVSH